MSFVSPEHVRQMADSEAVLETFYSSLRDGASAPEIIGIVVNQKGAGTRVGCSRRDHDWISVLDLSLFSARQCQYVPRRIAQPR